MDRKYLTLDITYHMNDGSFEIKSDIKEEAYKDIISDFIRSQMGQGADDSPANELDTYRITLRWYPENDAITAESDTGNKGLREGILMEILRQL